MSTLEQRATDMSSATGADAEGSGASGPPGFANGLTQFRKWCDDIAQAIAEYQAWSEHQGEVDGEQDLRVYELVENLKSDKLCIALVGEFSRGKTELLNALFFSEFKHRLLPSAAGRTTMCPTELRYDEREQPCIKLLPIETRRTTLTISEYRHTPVHWTTMHILKPNSAEEVREAFNEVTRTKKVNVHEAKELGLYMPEDGTPEATATTVEIPVWRHAIINYPHPLLKQGLVILDTPGLNALGAEPELTLKMLPDAHVVLFLLGADTGVTMTDLEVWRKHVNGFRNANAPGRFVVLNKIDILWDELQDESRIAATLAKQSREVARTLNIDEDKIFPVSAQKALAARIRGDGPLLRRSGLFALEQRLARDIIPEKYEFIRAKIVYEISGRVNTSRAVLQAKTGAVGKQLAQLKQLGGKNADAIHKMVTRVRGEKQQYDRELEGFEVTRAALSARAKTLLAPLSLASLDALIAQTRTDMRESWTTHGLTAGMGTFFAGTRKCMEQVAQQADSIKKDVEALYQRLHMQYGFARLQPPPLALSPYIVEFKKLEARAEAFRTSPVTIMTEQHFIIKKFFITLVGHARQLFDECNKSAKAWFQALVTPAFTQLHDHRARIEAQLDAVRKIHKNLDSLGGHIAELSATEQDLKRQLEILDRVLDRISQQVP